MTGDDIREALKRLKLSQLQAAAICGVSDRTFRSWISNQYRPPWTASIMIRLCLADRENLKRAQRWSEELLE